LAGARLGWISEKWPILDLPELELKSSATLVVSNTSNFKTASWPDSLGF